MVEFSHIKGIDILISECTSPQLANICLHSSTSATIYPFTENDENLLSKNREDLVKRPSMMFSRNTAVDKTHVRKSTKVCKSIVVKDASQF